VPDWIHSRIFERTRPLGRLLIPAMLTRLTPWTRRVAGWLILMVVASAPLRAEVLETINSLTITNLTGYVIASDAVFGGAGHTRDTIDVQSEISYTRSIANSNYIFEYTYQYRLLDEAGVAQSLRDGFDTVTVVSRDVSINRTLVIPYPAVVRTVQLVPAARLDPYQQYRVELRLLRRVSGSIGRPTATGDVMTTAAATFYHFPSTTATDADVNVIPLLNSVNWSRTYLLTDGGSQEQSPGPGGVPGLSMGSVEPFIADQRYPVLFRPGADGCGDGCGDSPWCKAGFRVTRGDGDLCQWDTGRANGGEPECDALVLADRPVGSDQQDLIG